jgi:hypothetical protein
MVSRAHKSIRPDRLVGLPGFEPGTKGFALPVSFLAARTISSPSGTNYPVGCGTLEPVIKGAEAPR